MGLVYQIPKTARYLQTRNVFTALFNNPSLGLYDFNVPATNANVPVIQLNQNAIYLINRITVGGTIPQEEYLFNLIEVPQLVFKFATETQRIYSMAIPIVQFFDGLEAVVWFWTEKQGETLTADIVTGVFSQDAFLIGTPSIKLNITLSIFEITDNGFIQEFKNDNQRSFIGKRTALVNSDLMFAR